MNYFDHNKKDSYNGLLIGIIGMIIIIIFFKLLS